MRLLVFALHAWRRTCLFGGLASCLFVLLSSVIAKAQSSTSTYSLDWVRGEGAEQCASSQLLARALEAHLGPVLRNASEAELAIEGSITLLQAELYEVRTRVLTQPGVVMGMRTMQRRASHCAQVTPAILLVLTLTIDPSAAAHGFPTELLAQLSIEGEPDAALLREIDQPAPAQPKPEPVVPRPRHVAQRAPLPKPPNRPQRLWRATLQLGPAMAFALLPKTTAGMVMSAGIDTPRAFALLLAASYWAPAEAHLESGERAKSVAFSAVASQLTACGPVLRRAPWRFSGCAGAALGLRWVSDSELTETARLQRVFGGPLAQLSLRYGLSARFYAALDVLATVSVRRDTFTYLDSTRGARSLYEPSLLASFGSLSIGVLL